MRKLSTGEGIGVALAVVVGGVSFFWGPIAKAIMGPMQITSPAPQE